MVIDYLLALPSGCAQYNDQAARSVLPPFLSISYVVTLTCQFIFKLVVAPAGLDSLNLTQKR